MGDKSKAATDAERQKTDAERQKTDAERQKWDDLYASLPIVKIDDGMLRFGKELAQRARELLPSGGRILEAGCGGGWQSLVLAQEGFDVTLLDFSTEALNYARKAFAEHHLSAEFLCQDVFEPGRPDYDLVFNAGVLEHYTLDQQAAFLHGMAGRSRKYVMALAPNRMCYWYWLWRMQQSSRGNWPYGKEVPVTDLSAAFRAAGLNFLGQWFNGDNWTEFFIRGLAGIDARLREEILAIHNSPVIPGEERSYMVAGLGCKGEVAAEVAAVPACWKQSGGNDPFAVDQFAASLADSLALSVAAEHRRQQAENRLRERQDEFDSQSARLAERERQLNEAIGELDAITGSRAWALIQCWRAARLRLAPRGSLRESAGRSAWRAARLLASPRNLSKSLTRSAFRRLPLSLQYRIRSAVATLRYGRRLSGFVLDNQEAAVEVPGLVSVVLPVYNQANLLGDAVESVLAQTYWNFELIVVNDGSRDGVEKVLEKYAGHPQVRILSQDNQKLSKALSNGFEFARGEFWTWTSADNLMQPDQLRRQVDFLQKHPETGMVFADYTAIDAEGRPLADPTFRPHNRRAPRDPNIHLPHDVRLFGQNADNFLGPCFLYRSWVGRLVGEYDPVLGIEDFDYWLRLNLVASIAHLDSDEPLYQYRVHDNSLSGQAEELQIAERAVQLMEFHRARKAFHAAPWTIHADAATLERLNPTDAGAHRVVPWSGGPPAGQKGEKIMLLVEAENLPAAARNRGSAVDCLAAWFTADADSPNRYRAESRGAADLCFAADDATAARLAMLMPNVFRASPGPMLVAMATAWADGRTFYEANRPKAERVRSLPRVFRSEKQSVRVLMQADDFTEGGTEQVVLDVASSLRADQFDVSLLILGKQGADVAKLRQAGIPVLTLPAWNRESHYRRLLKDRKIDVVNAHYSLFGASVAAAAGVPFVQNIHSSYVYLPPDGVAAYRANDPYTSAYACVSQMAAHYSDVKLGLPVSKMVLMPNGVDLARLDAVAPNARLALRRELGLSDDDFVFLNVANFQPLKCQAALVRTFAEVVRRQPEAKLVLVGQKMYMYPKYFDEVKQTVADHGLEHAVLFAGLRRDAPRFYAAADAFVLPSLVEGWSLALGEAVAAGLPAVATSVGSAPDLLPRIGGRLVRPPFGDITNLEYRNLGDYYDGEYPEFTASLAAAMQDVCRERSRP